MKKIRVDVKVLPGEPTDGSGRVCIHLFVRDPKGPFVEGHVLHPILNADGTQKGREVRAAPTRGRLACDPRRTVAPIVRGGVATLTLRTDDPRGATCPKCLASPEYAELVGAVARIERERAEAAKAAAEAQVAKG